MILSNLCARGREAYAEFEKFEETFRVKGRVQSMVMMYIKHKEFMNHLRECGLCPSIEENNEI